MEYNKYNNVHKLTILCKSLKTEIIIKTIYMYNDTNLFPYHLL